MAKKPNPSAPVKLSAVKPSVGTVNENKPLESPEIDLPGLPPSREADNVSAHSHQEHVTNEPIEIIEESLVAHPAHSNESLAMNMSILIQQNKEMLGQLKELTKDNEELTKTLKVQAQEIALLKQGSGEQGHVHSPNENWGMRKVNSMHEYSQAERIELMKRKFAYNSTRDKKGRLKSSPNSMTGELTKSASSPLKVNLVPRG